MPNPVLLAQNLDFSPGPTITANATVGGEQTGTVEVEFKGASSGQFPLWILDGQHRIQGLAQSQQADRLIPVVLLIKDGENSFSAAQFAQIFAQVTTEAEDLKAEHREWLSYAFHLNKYDPLPPGNAGNRDAFATAVELCRNPSSPSVSAKPFFNHIKFNPFLEVTGGFNHSCHELATLLKKHYFGLPTVGVPHLDPALLANQLSQAHNDLYTSIALPADSVFFAAKSDGGERIMQDAFLIGVLSFLRKHGPPQAGAPATSWKDLLNRLDFPSGNWNFKTWAKSLNGDAQRLSREIALSLFEHYFADPALPPPSVVGAKPPDLIQMLKGTGAWVRFSVSQATAGGAPSRKDRRDETFAVDGAPALKTRAGDAFVKLEATEKNVGRAWLEISSPGKGPSHRYPSKQIPLGNGIDEHEPPFDLHVRSFLYGGIEKVVVINVGP